MELRDQGQMAKEKLLSLGTQDPWDQTALDAEFDVISLPHGTDPTTLDETLRQEIRLGTLKGHSHVDGAFFDLFANMHTFANYGVGYDSIDTKAATARGIRVTNTPDVLSADVADLAIGLLLSFLRQFRGAEDWLRSGDWGTKGEYPLQRTMSGQKTGIVGLGRIGRAIAERMRAFDNEIHYYSRAPKDTPDGWTYHATPQALAAEVDFLIVALSGGPDTAGLVDKATIAALGPEGVLINISRGSTIDEEALITALETKSIAGAGLDVFVGEPNPDPRFRTLDNAVLLPHVASATQASRRAMGALVRANLIAARDGQELLTPVN